jgi:hypothetical protein
MYRRVVRVCNVLYTATAIVLLITINSKVYLFNNVNIGVHWCHNVNGTDTYCKLHLQYVNRRGKLKYAPSIQVALHA